MSRATAPSSAMSSTPKNPFNTPATISLDVRLSSAYNTRIPFACLSSSTLIAPTSTTLNLQLLLPIPNLAYVIFIYLPIEGMKRSSFKGG
ncbi:hypothetical protein MBAV_001397 [Candidatus Magnetobacterium bavaricum]|uniref:Uncharacterized protein n=1 Tax=Candidatus Magnetobacterium bavaricum TaxID=29290 RepID=A0A0F3GX32_9BACT|nr:hypothetical protein MBAV_001397 [Candidatus Magnetobacterium bavaricum]